MDARGVVELLRIKIKNRFPSNEKAAADMNIGIDHLSQILNGRAVPGPKVLKWLGLKRVYHYEYDGLPPL